MSQLHGKRIHINGIVQGVGFRPFVFGLAHELELTGWVRNTSAGVDIEVDGTVVNLTAFITALNNDFPPLAQIDEVSVEDTPANGFNRFEIIYSESVVGAFQPISPDVSLCDDCLRELFDPADRRYQYPFINCTNCGPRFTIIKDIPYDRPLTTMAPFPMCPDCAAEYEDPRDRRFHAQPVACPVCGPQVWLEEWDADERGWTRIEEKEKATLAARKLLAEGKILAVKGLGGFHLACDGLDETAVAELRYRKLRREKPFALMLPNIETTEQNCYVNDAERELLLSRERPIVLLRRRPDSSIAHQCAPGQAHLGIMLPYTPLHHLLFEGSRGATTYGRKEQRSDDLRSKGAEERRPTVVRSAEDALSPSPHPPTALVMTSGNLSEEPIAYHNDEARERLASLADAFLMHDRDIHVRCDDSVMRVVGEPLSVSGEPSAVNREPSTVYGIQNTDYELRNTDYALRTLLPIRRSRGYAPFPVKLPWEIPPTLAAGAELKNTFCLTNGRYAFLSHHIGDMENYETLTSFEEGVAHFERLFRVKPELIAYDFHPNYLASRYALERAERERITAVGVQHHHAHIAACLAENGHVGDSPVIGVSFDGTGYGDDGAIWGGEFLIADYAAYQRPYHLTYIPLPGGDKAIKEPWRLALAWLYQTNHDWSDDLPSIQYATNLTSAGRQSPVSNLQSLHHQLKTHLNAPPTSSMGRLFDAVAALAGVRQTVNYEAQAAMELEALVDPDEINGYPFAIDSDSQNGYSQLIDPTPLITAVLHDLRAHTPLPTIAARFHNGVAHMVLDVCQQLRQQTNINEVALSGGVWQNVTLLRQTVSLLQKENFTIYLHTKVPPNDGGLALGQAAITYVKNL